MDGIVHEKIPVEALVPDVIRFHRPPLFVVNSIFTREVEVDDQVI